MFCRAFVPLCSVVIYVLIGSELPVGRPRVGFEEDITKRGCHWPTVTVRTSLPQVLVCAKAMHRLSRTPSCRSNGRSNSRDPFLAMGRTSTWRKKLCSVSHMLCPVNLGVLSLTARKLGQNITGPAANRLCDRRATGHAPGLGVLGSACHGNCSRRCGPSRSHRSARHGRQEQRYGRSRWQS